jgi:hypothetical protein
LNEHLPLSAAVLLGMTAATIVTHFLELRG